MRWGLWLGLGIWGAIIFWGPDLVVHAIRGKNYRYPDVTGGGANRLGAFMSADAPMRSNCIIAALLLLLFATTGCNRSDEPQLLLRHDGKQSYKEFKAKVKPFPYRASDERKERILVRYAQLEIGMPKDQIAALIGEPDYSQVSYGPKGPNERWLGSSWSYYFYKRDDGGNFDPGVRVFFGTNDRAEWIVPTHIEGLVEKGSLIHADSLN